MTHQKWSVKLIVSAKNLMQSKCRGGNAIWVSVPLPLNTPSESTFFIFSGGGVFRGLFNFSKKKSISNQSYILHPTKPPFRPLFSKNKGGGSWRIFSDLKKISPTASSKILLQNRRLRRACNDSIKVCI